MRVVRLGARRGHATGSACGGDDDAATVRGGMYSRHVHYSVERVSQSGVLGCSDPRNGEWELGTAEPELVGQRQVCSPRAYANCSALGVVRLGMGFGCCL